MSELLNKFSFVTASISGEVAIFLLLIWAIILTCAISSVRVQPWSEGQRRFWVWVMICLPIVGLLAYLPFSFRREDLPNHFMLRNKDARKNTGRRGPIIAPDKA